MKILFLTTRLPYPLDTGAKIRTWKLFSHAAGRHDVTLMTFLHSKSDRRWVKTAQSLVPTARIETVDHPDSWSRIARVGSMAGRLLSTRPYTVVKYDVKAMQNRIEILIAQGGYDLIHCDQIHMAPYLIGRTRLPVVLNEHNIESSLLQRVADVQRNPVMRRFYQGQQRKMERYERTVCAASERVLTVSAMDRDRLAHLAPGTVSSIVINGVDTGYFQPTEAPTGPPSMVFTGLMNWMPNVEGVIFFLKEILPLIRKAVPGVRFNVVGRDPVAKLRRAANGDPDTDVTGDVPDVRPWLAGASVVVVPLRSGGGTRLKILEAMAMGKAVVSTRIGAEGLDLEDGREICIADNPFKFAERTVALLLDRAKAAQIGQAARRRVVESFDWQVAGRQLLEAYEHAVQARGTKGSMDSARG
ncbi:MAG: glycosyltransferase [Nitrospirae bacterium]|nr:glycosyltransferase [Nitrospirota bacterium]